MSLSSKLLIGLCSIIIALIALAVINGSGLADDMLHKYVGQNINDFGQLSLYAGKSYLEKLKGVMFLIIIFLFIYCIIFSSIFEVLAVLYFIFSSKWRKPSVFISYKNSDKDSKVDTTNIANAIKVHLEQKGFRTNYFQYTTSLHHDEVNHQIQDQIRNSHALIAIPDPYQPSYVNSEIQCAVYDRKPVYLIKHTKDQKLPDTANSGHTIFIWAKLKKEQYASLTYLLKYVHNYWTTRSFILYTPLLSFISPFMLLFAEDGYPITSLIILALLTAGLIYFSIPLAYVLIGVKITGTAIAAFGTYSTLCAIAERNQQHKIAKQSILSGISAFESFKNAGIDKKYLETMDSKGLAV